MQKARQVGGSLPPIPLWRFNQRAFEASLRQWLLELKHAVAAAGILDLEKRQKTDF
jgi:hypothetical protein